MKFHFQHEVPLLVFVDCLVLLLLLQKLGQSEFWRTRDFLHFNVLFPLIRELCQWTEQLTLVKVKSHFGCELNKMADERADDCCASNAEPIYPGQQKYGSLLLRI